MREKTRYAALRKSKTPIYSQFTCQR